MTQETRKDNQNGKFGSFLAGSFIGGLSAAAMILLYAPRSGRETQEQLRTKADELKDEARAAIQSSRVTAGDSLATGIDSIAGRLSQIASTLDQHAEQIRES